MTATWRFQDAASRAINDALRNRSEGGAVIDTLNRMFEESFV